MRKISYLSHVPFWWLRNGGEQRDYRLLSYLSKHFDVQVIFRGDIGPEDIKALDNLDLTLEFMPLGIGRELGEEDWHKLLLEIPASKLDTSAIIVRGLENLFLLDALPPNVPTFLDSMDLVSERSQQDGSDVLPTMSREEEMAAFDRFSQVICIQENEAEIVSDWLGRERVVTARHPVDPSEYLAGRDRKNIGFIASYWPPNAYGLKDFIQNCWPQVRRSGAKLNVYGGVCDRLRARVPAVSFNGFVDDIEACYATLGIMINPVMFGAGIKIKSLEAMAHGIPLVTTREGASGIEHVDGEAILIADTWEHFTDHLLMLQSDEAKCESLARQAIQVVRDEFSEDACFSALHQRLTAC